MSLHIERLVRPRRPFNEIVPLNLVGIRLGPRRPLRREENKLDEEGDDAKVENPRKCSPAQGCSHGGGETKKREREKGRASAVRAESIELFSSEKGLMHDRPSEQQNNCKSFLHSRAFLEPHRYSHLGRSIICNSTSNCWVNTVFMVGAVMVISALNSVSSTNEVNTGSVDTVCGVRMRFVIADEDRCFRIIRSTLLQSTECITLWGLGTG